VTALGERIKRLRGERELQQRQLAEKAGLTPSMVSQIESGRLSPSLHTLGKIASAFGVPIAALFDGKPNGSIVISHKRDYPVVSFDGSSERWAVLGAGLFQGKIRAVVSTLGPKSRGFTTEKVIIKPGQLKLFYVLEGKVALHYDGDRHLLEAGDSALLDGGVAHGWENLGGQLTGRPLCVHSGYGRLDCFARNAEGALGHLWRDRPDQPWSGWETLGGHITSAPECVVCESVPTTSCPGSA